jgi:formamidopyrimidine-DNA glycosylase
MCYAKFVDEIKKVLTKAIKQGGTTLRDFVQVEGNPGYFAQHLNVYGKAGEQCLVCDSVIKQIKQGQRSTFYCASCQR